MISTKINEKEKNFEIEFFDETVLTMPIKKLNEKISIALFDINNNTKFIKKACRELYHSCNKETTTLVTMPTKGIPIMLYLAEEFNKNNKEVNTITLSKEKKLNHDNPISTDYSAITSISKDQKLFLGENYKEFIENKNIIIVDDVISSGASINSAINLLKRFNPKSIEIVAIFKEENDDLSLPYTFNYLIDLPIFINEK